MGHERNGQYPEIRAKGGVAVSAQGDVQVILQPARQRDVPAFQKLLQFGALYGELKLRGR